MKQLFNTQRDLATPPWPFGFGGMGLMRGKLVLCLVPALVVCLLFIGTVLVSGGQEALRQATFHHLQSVADIQSRRIKGVIAHEKRVLASMQSRSTLRRSLRDMIDGRDVAANEAGIRRILDDARKSDPSLLELSVADPDGRVVASTTDGRTGAVVAGLQEFEAGLKASHMGQFFFDRARRLAVAVSGPLELEGRIVGVLMMTTDAAEFLDLSKDYSGLGETGEVVLGRRNSDGDALYLTPLRFDPDAALRRTVPRSNTQIPINIALSGREGLFLSLPDYRGVPVLAVTQYLPEVGLGMVVKIDQAEAIAPAKHVEDRFWILFSVAMTLMTIAVIWVVRANALAETRRQQLEENQAVQKRLSTLGAIVDSSDDAIVSKGLDSIVTSWNPGAERLFGYAAAEVIGHPMTMLFPPGLEYQEKEIIARIAAGETVKHFEAQRRCKDGSLLDVSITISPIHDARGRVVGASGVARDISERKREAQELDTYRKHLEDVVAERTAQIRETNQRLEAALTEAKVASEAKSQFLANMSHEIRTPMNAVLGFMGLVLEGELTDTTRRQLTTAHNAAKSLLLLLNDILDISKLQSGRIELERIPFNLPRVLRSSLDMLQIKARDKKLDIQLLFPADMPQCYVGDTMRIRQIVTNLVGNAIKFTDKGDVVVSVVEGAEPGTIQLSVRDTGIGMTPEQTGRIFTPFVQADSTTTRRFGGTGLGVSICKQLAEVMGGRIWVESHPGQGSTFHVLLRLERPTHDCDCPDEGFSSDAAVQSRVRYRILLVDDIEENIELAEARLCGLGHTVTSVRTGRQAVELADSGAFDLILMDVHMPEMNGLEATREIRRRHRGAEYQVPIVALTASVLLSEREQCFEAGMNAFTGKPIDFAELVRLMESLVPPGRGEAVEVVAVPLGPAAGALPPLAGIDVADGMLRWNHQERYKAALIRFVATHADAVPRLHHLHADGDWAAAYELAHALKGAAGNLAMSDIARIAALLSDAFKQHQGNVEGLLAELGLAWDVVAAATAVLVPPVRDGGGAAPGKMADDTGDAGMLRALRVALETDDPGAVERVLDHQGGALEPARLALLRRLLDEFEFSEARALVDQWSAAAAASSSSSTVT